MTFLRVGRDAMRGYEAVRDGNYQSLKLWEKGQGRIGG